jgi:hypothetical protein
VAGDDRGPFERTWELLDNVQLPEKPTLAEEIAEAFARIQDDSPAEPGERLSEPTRRELTRLLTRRLAHRDDPDLSFRRIADKLGISKTTVARYWTRMQPD